MERAIGTPLSGAEPGQRHHIHKSIHPDFQKLEASNELFRKEGDTSPPDASLTLLTLLSKHTRSINYKGRCKSKFILEPNKRQFSWVIDSDVFKGDFVTN